MTSEERLDPLRIPLHGQRLIEASAGTGKTFTITTIYLRLLLGLDAPDTAGHKKAPLTIEQILVVTFTEAATQALRERIRTRIRELRLSCQKMGREHPLLCELLEQVTDRRAAAERLMLAENQLNEAAISTIHGFCHRILAQYAIEANVPFIQPLVPDVEKLQREVVADYWRRNFYPLSPQIAQEIQRLWSGPDDLYLTLAPLLSGDPPTLIYHHGHGATIKERHQKIIEQINLTKDLWHQSSAELQALLSSSKINKRRYQPRHLALWLAAVDDWSQQETSDYELPAALGRFRQSELEAATPEGEMAPQQQLFIQIDALYSHPLTLKDLIISQALPAVLTGVDQLKRQRTAISFDDLLSRLDQALHSEGGAELAEEIAQRYPAALIDEFQDTDGAQYRIFQAIYCNQMAGRLLLLIGDPKQAIYSFRGADIFTYMRARRATEHRYTLGTNWRSAKSVVDGVNRLFSRSGKPFVFANDIPFSPADWAPGKDQLHFKLAEKPQEALQWYLLSGERVTKESYRQTMASCCAASIRDWIELGEQQLATLEQSGVCRPVSAGDIAVLVRTAHEAEAIRVALAALAIPSAYLSNRKSVFASPLAVELLRLLRAVLDPEEEDYLRSALAGTIFRLNGAELQQLSLDGLLWEQVVEEFYDYLHTWRKFGILAMLHKLLQRRKLAEIWLATPGGERELTDLRHLGELLQSAAQQLDSEPALVRWLEQQILQPDSALKNQQLRLENESQLVKIITIHKSKGLEYPLVWFPFPSNFRATASPLYHDRRTTVATLDLRDGVEAHRLAEEERLAEDVRLVYVALTRAIFHCSIGIAPLTGSKKSGTEFTGAMDHLLGTTGAISATQLHSALEKVYGPQLALRVIEAPPIASPLTPAKVEPQLRARHLTRPVEPQWSVTSYSSLQQQSAQQHEGHEDEQPLPDSPMLQPPLTQGEPNYSVHDFPRGAESGTFLHSLLELAPFNSPIEESWLAGQMVKNGFGAEWLPTLQIWLNAILQTPLAADGLALRELGPSHRVAEMQFHLSIEGKLQAENLVGLMRAHDPVSRRAALLEFQQVKGFLQGFIDLVFVWHGRYYIADYKSNWLGDGAEAYQESSMVQSICEHRYDLQYQLYSLALHRHLAKRLPNYRYQEHFGGLFYLFLRGMSGELGGNGVFFYRPPYALVDGLDRLFSGQKVTV